MKQLSKIKTSIFALALCALASTAHAAPNNMWEVTIGDVDPAEFYYVSLSGSASYDAFKFTPYNGTTGSRVQLIRPTGALINVPNNVQFHLQVMSNVLPQTCRDLMYAVAETAKLQKNLNVPLINRSGFRITFNTPVATYSAGTSAGSTTVLSITSAAGVECTTL